MITIKNVKTLAGEIVDHQIPSTTEYEIQAHKKLLLFPGIIDPHVCFGPIESANWNLTVQSAIRGGITTAINIPANILPHNGRKELEQLNKKILNGLTKLEIPLNYFHYLSFSEANLSEVGQLGVEKDLIKGIVILLESDQLEDFEDQWNRLFQLAGQEDIPILIDAWGKPFLLEKAIEYTEKWSNRLFVLNVSTKHEIDLIQEARNRALLVYAETTPRNLFQEHSLDKESLWQALNHEIIDTIGSGFHAGCSREDRILYHGGDFCFDDPAFLLPLMLNAVHEKKISIEKLVRLTSTHVQDILELPKRNDFVLIDLEKEQTVTHIRNGHSADMTLRGWPAYTVVNGEVFCPPKFGYALAHQQSSI